MKRDPVRVRQMLKAAATRYGTKHTVAGATKSTGRRPRPITLPKLKCQEKAE